ncbi:hypothetical protein Q5P01_013648 [Channa striata]|uniref:Ig-like domain-containing protein n=1 Tax=Channa striata TaxID=64152 RepID=A0AA88SJC0_CHASR|nr:hypothetical protein Q5P01_013648 [Channa striata]
MGEMQWIFAVIILSVSETWSLEAGTNHSTFDNSSTTPPPKVHVVKNVTFDLKTDVNLTCGDKMWNGTIYVIWKIHKSNECEIGFNNFGNKTDSCGDKKSLQNISSSQPYLHIPTFATSDTGVYMCEWVYTGGSENYVINVAIRVTPTVSVRLEKKDNKTVAVCKAEKGKPAPNISWSHPGNHSTEVKPESDGYFTVLGRFEIPEGMAPENLSCIVGNKYWPLMEEVNPKKGNLLLLCLTICVVVVFLAGILVFAQKKLVILRRCRHSDTSSSSKTPPTEDVEEVEPYASYVQRVNSIYNSSADFSSHKSPAHASH